MAQDKELLVIQRVIRYLEQLDADNRARVIAYLSQRYQNGQP